MLVIVGANGRTGVEVLNEAKRRGLATRAVVRDDRDVGNLRGAVDAQALHYADADHADSLVAVMEGATEVLSLVEHRTGGPGSPVYGREAAANVVRAATRAGARRVLHVSVMGSYRWSFAPLNRKAFHLDEHVRQCEGPWGILRVSCYHDEVVDAHVRPPDGGAPWPLAGNGRYSPVSRRDAAAMILDHLRRMSPGRNQTVGGPEVLTGPQIGELVRGVAQGGRRRTRLPPLPPGDISVTPAATRIVMGWVPRERLADALAGRPPSQGEPGPVYRRDAPGPHATDTGEAWEALRGMGAELRRALHAALAEDCARIGVDPAGARLDFSRARAGARRAAAHDGEIADLFGVRLLAGDGRVVHAGNVDFVRDALAEEMVVWWADDAGIPEAIWDRLDMGVRRRLAKDPHFRNDPRVRG